MGTLGQTLGIIIDAFNVTNDAGEVVEGFRAKYDCTKAPDTVVKSWIAGNRRIAYQTKLRKLSAAEIRALSGKTVVCDGGRSVAMKVDPYTAVMLQAEADGIDTNDAAALMKYIKENMK